MKYIIYIFICINILSAEDYTNLTNENFNDIMNKKEEVKQNLLQEEYIKIIEEKKKQLKKEQKVINKEKEELKKQKEELVLLENRIKKLKKEIEGKVTNKILKSFEANKPGVNAEIVTEMFKLNKKDTIKLLIMQKEETIQSIMKKMEPVDSAKLLKELINYKTKLN